MKRRQDWPSRLAACVESARDKPFQWGSHDCALFVADAVASMTDQDIAAPWRGTYASEIEARALMREICGGDLRALWTKAFGPAMNNPLMAQRGDCVLVENDGREVSAILIGGGVAVAPGPDSLEAMPADRVVAAWRTAR